MPSAHALFRGPTRVPGCPTTTLEVVGNRVLAKRRFRAGEVSG